MVDLALDTQHRRASSSRMYLSFLSVCDFFSEKRITVAALGNTSRSSARVGAGTDVAMPL